MPAFFSFTTPPFTVASAAAIDANTVRVILTTVPNAFVPANFSIATTTIVAAVTDPGDPNSVILSCSPGLVAGNYTVVCSGLTATTPPVPMTAPFSAAFQVFVGPSVAIAPQFATPATNPGALTTLRAHVPPSMKGTVWTQLLATLGDEEQFAWDQAAAVYDQLFLVSAEGKYLDQRASEEGGYTRPELVGFTDDVFRDLVIQLSTRQLTLNAFLRILEIYFGLDVVRAHVRTTAAEPFNIPDGSEQVFNVDGIGPFTVVLHAADFTNAAQATAIETAIALNRGFATVGVKVLALPFADFQTGLTYLTVYTNSRGLKGSIEAVSGPLPLSTGKQTIQTQARAAYVKVANGNVEVVLPATSPVVSREPVSTAAYLFDSSAESGDSPYLHDPTTSTVVTETATALAQPLEANHRYPFIQVASTAGFPDEKGYVVFGFGFSYEVGPVPYLGVSGANTLLLDPSFTVPVAVPSGVVVNLAARMSDDQVPHGDGDFWLTPSPAGRVACEANLDTIAAGGHEVVKTVLYPGDVGLGAAGRPTHGVARLTGAVSVWGGDDLDAEMAAARSN